MLTLNKFSNVRTTDFAFKEYPNKPGIFFEILLSMDEEFVCKLRPKQFNDLVNKVEVIINEKDSVGSNYYFFGKEYVDGGMSVYDMLHDAVPKNRFFRKYKNSVYNNPRRLNEYPIGLSAGHAIFTKKNPKLEFNLNDFNKKLSGDYTLKPIKEDAIAIKRLNDIVKNTL